MVRRALGRVGGSRPVSVIVQKGAPVQRSLSGTKPAAARTARHSITARVPAARWLTAPRLKLAAPILHPFAGSVQQYTEQLVNPDSHRPGHCPQFQTKRPLTAHGFYTR